MAQRSQKKRFSKRSAFTLVEVLAVLSIVIVIMGLTVGLVAVVNLKTTESRAHKEIAVIVTAVEKYKLDWGTYPAQTPSGVIPDDLQDYIGEKIRSETTKDESSGEAIGLSIKYIDPWGSPYRYTKVNEHIMRVGTVGPDKQPGVAGHDDDDAGSTDDDGEFGYGDDITNQPK